jgi:hypothetical protein
MPILAPREPGVLELAQGQLHQTVIDSSVIAMKKCGQILPVDGRHFQVRYDGD